MIFKNEWRIILRTPVYALNSLIGVIIGPVIMIIPLFGGALAPDPDLQAIFALIDWFGSSPVRVLIFSGILTLFGALNAAVSSTYSREGSTLWVLKSIPVKPQVQAAGKLMAGYSISLACAIATSLAMALSMKLSFLVWLSSAALSAAALFPVCLAGILIDLARPKLTGTTPPKPSSRT